MFCKNHKNILDLIVGAYNRQYSSTAAHATLSHSDERISIKYKAGSEPAYSLYFIQNYVREQFYAIKKNTTFYVGFASLAPC